MPLYWKSIQAPLETSELTKLLNSEYIHHQGQRFFFYNDEVLSTNYFKGI